MKGKRKQNKITCDFYFKINIGPGERKALGTQPGERVTSRKDMRN